MRAPRNQTIAVIWSVGGLFCEAISVWCALSDCWLIALLAHALCAASLGCAATRSSAPTVAGWTFCLPVFAALGICAVLLPAFRRSREQERDRVVEIELTRPQPMTPRAAHNGSLRELLVEMGDDPAPRVAALMSLRHAELTHAAPLLRAALLDANEDIRLLAYALLERREQTLRARIAANEAQLSEEAPELFVPLEQLCSDHQQLVAAGFVTGEATAVTLMAALDYGERALWLRNDGSLRVLLAQICLRVHKPERAEVHLCHAERLGTARSVLAPLFAEVAFQLGRFAEVGPLLSVSTSACLARPEQGGARALWAGQELV